MGISDILYLKDFERERGVHANSITSELDHDYIQYSIVLHKLKNIGMTRGGGGYWAHSKYYLCQF